MYIYMYVYVYVQRYTAGLGALFFGEDDVRPAKIGGDDTHLENWGGDSLNVFPQKSPIHLPKSATYMSDTAPDLES